MNSRNRFDIWRNNAVPFPVLTAAEVMSRSRDPQASRNPLQHHLPFSASAVASKKVKKSLLDRAKRLLQHKPQPPNDAFMPASDDSTSTHPYIPAEPFVPTVDWHFSFSTLGRFFSSKERLGTALSVPFRKFVVRHKSRKH